MLPTSGGAAEVGPLRIVIIPQHDRPATTAPIGAMPVLVPVHGDGWCYRSLKRRCHTSKPPVVPKLAHRH